MLGRTSTRWAWCCSRCSLERLLWRRSIRCDGDCWQPMTMRIHALSSCVIWRHSRSRSGTACTPTARNVAPVQMPCSRNSSWPPVRRQPKLPASHPGGTGRSSKYVKLATGELPAQTSGKPPGRNWTFFKIRWVKIGLSAAVIVLALAGYLASRRYLAVRTADAEQLYVRAMNLLTDQSGEAELRAALDTLDRALAYDPNRTAAIRARLETLIRLFERTHESQWLKKARDALKNDTTARLSDPERTVLRARVDFNAGLLPNVIHALQSHADLLASSKDANLLLGRAHEGSGQLERALISYRAAIGLAPESWLAHNDLGSFLLRVGRLKESAKEFVRVTELKPDAPIGYSNLGSALLDVGDLPGARRSFEAALQRAASPAAYYGLGVTAYYSREYADRQRP